MTQHRQMGRMLEFDTGSDATAEARDCLQTKAVSYCELDTTNHGEHMHDVDDKDGWSEECREDVRAVLAFHESDARKRYSAERLDNELGDIEAAAEEGMRILSEHGREFLSNLMVPLTSKPT